MTNSRQNSSDPTPLRVEIADRILDDFRKGILGSGQFLPTELELSLRYQVSRGTVRQILTYLEDQGDIGKTKSGRRLVLQTQPRPATEDRLAVNGSQFRTHRTVYAWGFNPRDASVREFMSGMLEGLKAFDIPMHLEGSPYSQSHQSTTIEAAFVDYARDQEDCACLLVWSDFRSHPHKAYENFKLSGKPLIFVENPPPPGFACDHIAIAHEQAAYNLVKHAVGLGHTQIVGLSNGQNAVVMKERERGYTRAIVDFKLEESSRLLVPGVPQAGRPIGTWAIDESVEKYNWALEQQKVASDLIEQALFARKASLIIDLYDPSSTFVLPALQELQIELPRHLSLLSFARKHTATCATALQPTGVLVDYFHLGVKGSKLVSERTLGGIVPNYSSREIVTILPTIREGGTAAKSISS